MAIALPDFQQQPGPEGRFFFGHPVKVPIFEGPLDLLLYLIRKNDLDIYDIPIATITEQYLGYLALLDDLDIEPAGDFLVMAATLMEIKSRCLLPKPEILTEEEEASDPRAELIARLLEYRRYKEAATTLDDMAKENRFVLGRPPLNGNGNGESGFVLAGAVSAVHLWSAFQEVLSRAKETVPGEILRPRFTVAQKIAEIAARLRSHPEGLSFFSIFAEDVTKLEVIVTFLAILELIRQGRLRIKQRQLFSDIELFAKA